MILSLNLWNILICYYTRSYMIKFWLRHKKTLGKFKYSSRADNFTSSDIHPSYWIRFEKSFQCEIFV